MPTLKRNLVVVSAIRKQSVTCQPRIREENKNNEEGGAAGIKTIRTPFPDCKYVYELYSKNQ
ncbi:MAG: hypothetical protein NC412_05885 [Roseburia sp.]|nr:hypothetical protein [Roseburia sp.]